MPSNLSGLNQSRIWSLLLADPDRFAPLRLSEVVSPTPDNGYDLRIQITYRDRSLFFAVTVKTSSAPSVARKTIARLMEQPPARAYPLLAVPYLSPDLVTLLEEADISGIDLNGNYLIRTPEIVAIRLDQPNNYREPKLIRNVYAGNSSIVGRYLLSNPGPFSQVNELASGIATQGGGISLGTISKVLSGLADDLIIDRSGGKIRVVQSRRLLEKLRHAYRPPKITGVLRLKLPADRTAIESLLDETLGADGWIWSGESSAEHYTVTTPAQSLAAFTRADHKRVKLLQRYEDQRFYNCELRVSDDAFVYFARNDHWASIIECHLALSKLDKREQELAMEIESLILEATDGNVR